MALFRRDPPAAGGAATAPASGPAASDLAAGGSGRRVATLIASGTKIKGEVGGATDVQIDGEIEGRVAVEAVVVVGAGGAVRGPIAAHVVRVVGQVIGEVIASERVEVSPSGSLEGDIAAPRVVIAEGAFFKGKIDMKGDKNREPRRPPKGGAEAPKAAADAGSK
jgi:cytoskeletal protein CcmA (bactofilin family)